MSMSALLAQASSSACSGDGATGVGVVVVVAIGIALVVLDKLFNRRPAHPDLQGGLAENLAEYPPPPAISGTRRVSVQNLMARLRLVVIAPVGKMGEPIPATAAEAILDEVLHGLGAAARADKPRVKIWPPQLSNQGFAPTFHRLVQKPEPDGQPSRWVLLAGPVKAGNRPILLGLALLAEEASTLGRLSLEPNQWRDYLRIERD